MLTGFKPSGSSEMPLRTETRLSVVVRKDFGHNGAEGLTTKQLKRLQGVGHACKKTVHYDSLTARVDFVNVLKHTALHFHCSRSPCITTRHAQSAKATAATKLGLIDRYEENRNYLEPPV